MKLWINAAGRRSRPSRRHKMVAPMRFRFLTWVAVGLCFWTQHCAGGAEDGGIEGVIRYTGEVPKSRVKDNAAIRRDLLTVDRKTKGVRDVMVYLESPAVKADERPQKPVVVDQLEHRFVPHMIAIRGGQRVKFTNSDAANHNVRAVSLEERNTFNIYTAVGGEYEHVFYPTRKSHPVRLSCDIHPWMTAWLFVFEHPHFAVSDEKGRFRITNLAAGDYQLVVRQPDVGYLRRIDVSIEGGIVSKLELEFAHTDLKL